MENRRLKSRITRLAMFASLILMTTLIFFGVASWPLLFQGMQGAVPAFADTVKNFQASDRILLDRRGDPLYEIRVDFKSRRLQWTSIDAISPSLKSAVLEVEDRRFYEHGGFDFRAAAVALIRRVIPGLRGESVRGASTITMQLVSLLKIERLTDRTQGRGRRSLLQKYRQSLAALALEKRWSKDQIFEAYLNLVPFRGEAVGLSAASWMYFEKSPSGLDQEESTLLAVLIQSPNADAATISRRACRSRSELDPCPWSPEKVAALFQGDLGSSLAGNEGAGKTAATHTVRRFFNHAAHVARIAVKRGTLSTNLDGEIQRYAETSLGRVVHALRDRNVNDGAVLVAENATGNVLAYVGNVLGSTTETYVDGVRAKRQAGSTLKPFLYAEAFDRKILTPTSYLEDRPLAIAHATGIYSPQNYNKTFSGDVEARAALASSLNIPAVRALLLVGVESFRDKLQSLGFQGLREGAFYGPALALGAVDVSLWDLVKAYLVLARGGTAADISLFPADANPPLQTDLAAAEKENQVFSEGAAFLVADILADRGARSSTFGLENNLAMPFWAAVKTGTSKDMRDNWCVGFSKKYTVGVWVGNFSGEPMWDVSGIDGAAPVWRDVMNYVHRDGSGSSLADEVSPPASVVRLPYHDRSESSGGKREAQLVWYLKGTFPADGLEEAAEILPRISYPPHGMIMALDPDIPVQRQRVAFRMDQPSSNITWVLNDTVICDAAMAAKQTCTAKSPTWPIQRGNHHLELRSEAGKVLDSVEFQVR